MPSRPVRVLQCVYSLNRGGVETWLMHLLRNTVQSDLKIDFVVFGKVRGDYAKEAADLGSEVFQCVHPRYFLRFRRAFTKILTTREPYDVVHSHHPGWNGFVMKAAKANRVANRISHIHCADAPKRGVRRILHGLSKRQSLAHSTSILACSTDAGEVTLGRDWLQSELFSVLPCGIDFSPFDPNLGGESNYRQHFDIPDNAFVVTHVGNFRPQKNHHFLIHVFQQCKAMNPNAHLLLIGARGEAQAKIQSLVANLGLETDVTFTGTRNDVPALLGNTGDVFVFPSKSEGLGLALVEAQAAGLPCVCSTQVPIEADINPLQVKRLPLADGAVTWAREILTSVASCTRDEAYANALTSKYNIADSLAQIANIYSKHVAQNPLRT